MIKRICILFLVAFLVWGCDENITLSKNDFVQWVENPKNGCIKVKELNNISLTSFYKPPVYIALKKESNTSTTSDSLEKQVDALSFWYTFTFRIQSNTNLHPLENGNNSTQDYFKKLEYYINASKDFKLIVNNTDTLECAIYHMERNYGGAPYIDINLAFKRITENKENYTLLFLDRVFSNGLIKFNYKGNETKYLPKYVL